MNETQTTHVPVIIIGGGIVGLCASLFLSSQGIDSILVERHAGTSIHPRGRSVNARTMEIFRSMDVADAVREAGASMAPTKGIHSGVSLKSVLEKKPRAESEPKTTSLVRSFGIGPEDGLFVTQDMLEPVILKKARKIGGDIRFDNESLGVEQDEEKVTVRIKNRKSGKIFTITADYLIAADGANSPIRTQLNVQTTGCGRIGNLLNILFRADLKDLVEGREFSLCVIERPDVVGVFTSINNSDRWVFHLSYDPLKGEKADQFSKERCEELLRIALGIPDIDVQVISILPWEPSVRVTTKLQFGRIFLAGDAAHQMPPYGGQGANSGISDVHNLAWKLSAVLKGYANSRLLETYDIERQPVGKLAAEVSAALTSEQGLISTKKNWKTIKGFAKVLSLSSGFGYVYSSESPAVAREDRWPLGGLTWKAWSTPSLLFSLDGRPGSRVPHVIVEKEGKSISTIDLVGTGYVLIAGSAGEAWVRAGENIQNRWPSLVLAGYFVGHTDGAVIDRKNLWQTAAGIASSGVLLVRPDGYVAWRERKAPENIEKALECVLKAVLCLS